MESKELIWDTELPKFQERILTLTKSNYNPFFGREEKNIENEINECIDDDIEEENENADEEKIDVCNNCTLEGEFENSPESVSFNVGVNQNSVMKVTIQFSFENDDISKTNTETNSIIN